MPLVQIPQVLGDGVALVSGTGSPEGLIALGKGAIYLQVDSLDGLHGVWQKTTTSGATGWRLLDNNAVVNIRSFGAVGDGVANDTAAFTAAVNALNAKGGGTLYLPEGTYLLTSDPFAGISFVAPCRIVGAAMQSTILKKGFNGSWFTFGVNFGFFIRWENLTFDGQHDAGRTGAGFVYTGNSGGAGNDYHSYFRCRFLAIESHFSIGQDAAQVLSILDCEAYPSAAQQGTGEYVFFASSADDTFGQARHRRITHSLFPLGVIKIDGMQDFYMATTGCKRFETSSTTSQYFVSACLLGNSTSGEPLSGTGTVVGCRFAGDVVLHSSFSGAFVGNYQTAGTFTDNSVAGSVVVVHHPLGQGFHWVGQRTAIRTPTVEEVIQASHIDNLPDADATLNVTSHRVVRFNNALAANRTITLSTTGARNGDRIRVVRSGLGAFTMDVGGLKTIPSATAAFVDVEYNGSAWILTGYGLL